jgi:hypothetical protein
MPNPQSVDTGRIARRIRPTALSREYREASGSVAPGITPASHHSLQSPRGIAASAIFHSAFFIVCGCRYHTARFAELALNLE